MMICSYIFDFNSDVEGEFGCDFDGFYDLGLSLVMIVVAFVIWVWVRL